jgi:hypothetical protein
MYCSFFWRVFAGYKVYPSLGLVAGMMIWVISNQCHAKQRYSPKLWFSTVLFMVTGAILGVYFSLLVHWSQAGKDDVQRAQFNLCHLKNASNSQCSCLAPTIYGPQFFLEKDFLPCKGVFPTLPPGFFEYLPLIEKFSERYKTEPIAVLYYESIPAPYFPKYFLELIKQSVCQPFDALSQVCKYQK